MNTQSKFAVLSHILPPSPSGQSVMLYRLLKDIPSSKYCLISGENYQSAMNENSSSAKLPAYYYYLKPPIQLQTPKRLKLYIPCVILNSCLTILKRALQIVKIIRNENSSILISCTGDLYDIPASYLASRWTNVPLIPYIFDDYAYQWTGFQRYFSKFYERIILNGAKGIIVTNEYMKNEYIHRYGVKSVVIRNPSPIPDLEWLDKSDKIFDEKYINIVYTGAIYHANYDAFQNLIAAIQKLGRTDIKLHLFTAQPIAQLEKNRISGQMVVCHDHINQSEVHKVMRQADILFLPLAFDSPIWKVIRTSAPGKMGEYMAVGKPILVHAPKDSFISWYFRKNQCGIVVDKNSVNLLSEALANLIANKKLQIQLGLQARKQAESDFTIAVMQAKFIELLKIIKKSE